MFRGSQLGHYTFLALCTATIAGCGGAPVKEANNTISNAVITTTESNSSIAEFAVSNPIQSPASSKPVVVPQPRGANNIPISKQALTAKSHNSTQNTQEALRRQQLAELEKKRAMYQRQWEAKRAQNEAQQVAEQARLRAEAAVEAKRRQYQLAYQQRQQQAQNQATLQKVSRTPPRPVTSQNSLGYGGRGIGNYSAASVTGTFAGNPKVLALIDKMVRKDGFNREYLNGVFSQARFLDDVASIWTKYYSNKDKPTTSSSGGGAGWTNYRGKFLTAGNIQKGQQFWNQYHADLMRAEQRYGVPAQYIVGIMGVETRWGRIFGNHRVLEALLTSALHVKHREAFFMSELENFLLMTRSERMDPLAPKGSYAGAMGYGQFMPSSFRSYAVDFNGDGVRDLWNPVDAIGSIANYFAKHGWRKGEETVIPAAATSNDYYTMPDGYKVKYSLGQLANKGIKPAVAHRARGTAYLLALSVSGGKKEAWIGFNNFYVITRYNHSTYYAMAVHQLGQAVAGNNSVYAQR